MAYHHNVRRAGRLLHLCATAASVFGACAPHEPRLALEWHRRLPFPDGLAGRGVTVAYVGDVFCTHPGLASTERRTVWYVDPTSDRWTEKEFARYGGDPYLEHELGIATLIGGNGPVPGIAPEANLLLVKGLPRGNGGETGEGPSTLSQAGLAKLIDWVAGQKERYGVRVMVMSHLQHDAIPDRRAPWQASPVCRAVERAAARGILVVGGTSNSPYVTPLPPSNAPSLLSVGGVTGGWDGPESWRLWGHSWGVAFGGKSMPEILAPCEALCPVPEQATYERAPPDFRGTPLEGTGLPYTAGRGVSFSGPFVAAVAALCLEVNPGLSPRDLRRVLLETADPLPGVPRERQGSGLINPRRAVKRAWQFEPEIPRPGETVTRDRVVEFLSSDDPERRSKALLWLFERGGRDEGAARSLIPLLRSPHPEVVCGALEYMTGFPGLREIVVGSALGEDKNPGVRFSWAKVVALRDDELTLHALSKLLKDPCTELRHMAAYLAQKSANEKLLPNLIDAMEDPEDLQLYTWSRIAAEKIAGRRFPPPPGPSVEARQRAVVRQWRDWLRERSR